MSLCFILVNFAGALEARELLREFRRAMKKIKERIQQDETSEITINFTTYPLSSIKDMLMQRY